MAQAQQQRQSQGATAPSARILRIGVVLGGNIIEERLVRKRETITIGQSSKNSFSIPIEGLPKTFPVFALVNGNYVLNFQDNMDGRISAGGGVHTLTQLKSNGAKRNGDSWSIELDERARGKVSVGAMTLLFQFVTAPPLPPRPRLPASVRGTLADRIEPRLAIILSASVVTHFAIGLWAYTRDQVVERPVDKIARSFQVGQYEPPPKVEPVIIEPIDGEEGEVEAEAAGTDTPKPDKPSKPNTNENTEPTGDNNSGSNDGSPDDAAVSEAINDSAVVAVLTGLGGAGGAFSEMSNTDQGASLDDSIAHAKGKATATTGGGGDDRRQRGQGSGELGTDKGNGNVTGPKGTEGGAGGTKKEDKITSLTKFGKAEDLSLSDLDPNSVVKRIRGKYLAGIKQCHQRVLKVDPKAQGKVTIRFTVGPTGRVTKASVKGFDPTVDACIRGQAANWRFSAPKDEGKPTSADFEVPLLLKPGG